MKKKAIFLFLVSILFAIVIIPTNVFAGTFTDLQNLINDNSTGKIKLTEDYTNSGAEAQIKLIKIWKLI